MDLLRSDVSLTASNMDRSEGTQYLILPFPPDCIRCYNMHRSSGTETEIRFRAVGLDSIL